MKAIPMEWWPARVAVNSGLPTEEHDAVKCVWVAEVGFRFVASGVMGAARP